MRACWTRRTCDEFAGMPAPDPGAGDGERGGGQQGRVSAGGVEKAQAGPLPSVLQWSKTCQVWFGGPRVYISGLRQFKEW